MNAIALNVTRVNELIGKLMLNNEEPSLNNIIFKSLTSPGGTVTEETELKEYLKENVFYFNAGIIFTDIENSLAYLNNKKLKVVRDFEFTHSIMKTKIKAIDGIEGFKKHISENRIFRSTFHSMINRILEQLKEN
jgi:hypothetical protein